MEYTPSFRDQLQNGIEPSWRDDIGVELYHHGIKGMKWGVRRPRNEDGIIQGAGAALAKKQKKLRAKASENESTARFSRKTADSIQRDANAHGAKAKATKNIIKKAGHRAAQLWDANAAADWRNTSRRFEKKAAKQTLKADTIKAKRELQDWGDKANARYEKDKKYRESGQIGTDAEKAVSKYSAAKKAAKTKYRQTVNAEKIAKANAKAKKLSSKASYHRNMAKAMTNKRLGAARVITAPAALAAKANEGIYTARSKSATKRANRLSR